MRAATWIVWENEGDTYTLKSASQGDLQLTVKRTDGRWEHLGVGKKDPKTFVDGIRNNQENTIIRIHERFKPKSKTHTQETREKLRQAAKARWEKIRGET